MPKQKTNKSVTKRFKITATGKVKHHKSNRRHLMNNRSSKVKRQSRGTEKTARLDVNTGTQAEVVPPVTTTASADDG